MPFANAAPKATRKPIINNVVESAFVMPIAAVDAIKRFEGPKKGIKLKPKEVRKMIINSIIDAMESFHFSSSLKKYPHTTLISASLYTLFWASFAEHNRSLVNLYAMLR
jgi:hypothetical protein